MHVQCLHVHAVILYHSFLWLQFEEEAFTLCSRALHLCHCARLEDDPVNFQRIWSELSFKTFGTQILQYICGGGLVADVMHDLLEGTLQYEAKLVLKQSCDSAALQYIQELYWFAGGFGIRLYGNGQQTHYDTITSNQLWWQASWPKRYDVTTSNIYMCMYMYMYIHPMAK